MKEPSLSCLRKKLNNNSNATNPSRKLKLVCSFNGSFYPRPPLGKLRYIGGETRIVSIDRNIGFSELRSKISDLCPNIHSFSLKYQFSASVRGGNTATDTPLVLITSDDDVRCMIEEYDKQELYGKQARLWVFVCNDGQYGNNGVVKGNGDLFENRVESNNSCGKNAARGESRVSFDPFCGCGNLFENPNSETHLCGGQFDGKVAKNPVTGIAGTRCGDEALRKLVLKRQLLGKQSTRVDSIHGVSGLGVNESEMSFSYCGANQKYNHPLIDLGPESQVSMTQGGPYRDNLVDYKSGTAQLMASEKYGSLVQFPGSHLHPLNPRDGNLRVDTNSSIQCLAERSGQVWCDVAGINAGNLNHQVAGAQASKQLYNSGVISMGNGFDARQDLRNMEQVSMSNLNRENIVPWVSNCNLVKTHFLPASYSNQWDGSVYPLKSPYAGNKLWGGCQNIIHNHRFGVNDSRNQRVYPYHMRNHRNNLAEMANHRTVRLDRRLSGGKYYPGLKPNSNISKQGQSMRIYCPHFCKPWHGFPDHSREEKVSMIDSGFNEDNFPFNFQYGNMKLREQGGPAVTCYGNSNPEDCCVAYHGACSGVDQSLLSCNVNEIQSSPQRVMGNQKYLPTGCNCETREVPHQTLYENFHGVQGNFEPICGNLEKEKFPVDQQKVVNVFGFSNNTGYSNGTALGGNTKLSDAEAGDNSLRNYKRDTHNLLGGILSSVDLLYNLSLSSSKEVEPPTLSSLASGDVSEALLNPHSKPLDVMDEGQFSTSPEVNKINGVASNSFSHNAAEVGNGGVHDPPSDLSIDEKADIKGSCKCSEVNGGIASNLNSFYTPLATPELQTINNSDLEYIKELGSGTYGTVFYGKWKGSDVAIKKIKPSCFTEGSLEEDRLVADFWKEAHMLGHLHHPNIVAFYGVVTDGPVTNLATVTEYMVNGSLKQVLRKKDRTIDRRKRLVIAMDAAFGMEYLHEKNVVHFDLKSHNFLVNMKDPQRPVCKIGDLGLSKIKQKTLVSGGVRGTIPWMAPELLINKNSVTEKIDVYSFGIVMWELLTGEEPYRNLRSEEIIAGIIKGTLRPEIPSWCDPTWRSLMERCWSFDPESRPTFSEIARELRAMSAGMNIK